MSQIRYRLYRAARNRLPPRMATWAGESRLTKPLRDLLIKTQGRHRLMDGFVRWNRLQFRFRAPYQTFYRAQKTGIENRICRLASAVLKAGDTAIDVGANYGFVSLVMAGCVAPHGRLLAFEIDPHIAEVTRHTLQGNGLAGVAQVIPQGAGSKSIDGLVAIDEVVGGREKSPIRFLKVDTDGSDFEVLEGAARTLRDERPVVVVEMSKNQRQIYRLLQGLGFQHFIDQENQAVDSAPWPENLIASFEPVRVPLEDA